MLLCIACLGLPVIPLDIVVEKCVDIEQYQLCTIILSYKGNYIVLNKL